MFDFGFAELFVIVAAGIFLIGPKEIPGLLQTLGQSLRRLQYIKYSMSEQFEKFMTENDLNEVRHFSVDPMGGKKDILDNVDEKEADEMLPLAKAEAFEMSHPRAGGDPAKPND